MRIGLQAMSTRMNRATPLLRLPHEEPSISTKRKEKVNEGMTRQDGVGEAEDTPGTPMNGGKTVPMQMRHEQKWRASVQGNSFVRGARPKSAPLRRREDCGESFPAGGGMAAARRKRVMSAKGPRKKKAPPKLPKEMRDRLDSMKQGLGKDRPSTAPVRREGNEGQRRSAKYIQQTTKKELEETADLINEARQEHEKFKRTCISRMAEATRWAQALGLGKKYNPIYMPVEATKRGHGPFRKNGLWSNSKEKELLLGNRNQGELMCEVVAKDDRFSRIISCQLFLREHQKLLIQHRKKIIEEEHRTNATVSQALANAYSTSGAAGGQTMLHKRPSFLSLLEHNNSERRLSIPGAGLVSSSQSAHSKQSSIQYGSSKNNNGNAPVTKLNASGNEIEKELRIVLQETKELTQALHNQIQEFKANGWNTSFW